MKNIHNSPAFIPKIIHQTWRDHNLPVDAELPESWQNQNKDWQYRFWTDDDLSEFVKTEYPKMWGLFSDAIIPVQKADIARYLIMHKFGGVYADIDTRCVGSLSVFEKENRVVLSQEPPEHWGFAEQRDMAMIVFNGTFASPPGHPFWPHVMEMLVRCRHATKSVLDSTGPLMLTGCVSSFANPEQIALHSCHLFNPTTKFGKNTESDEFGPYAPHRVSTHLWQGTWFSDKGPGTPKRLKLWWRKRKYEATRGEYLTRDDVMRELDPELLNAPLPPVPPPHTDNITILIPVRDAAPYLERCVDLILAMDYPSSRLKLVFCEGDSVDKSYDLLVDIQQKHRHRFPDIIIAQMHTGGQITRETRWHKNLQKQRRSNIARVRNHLIDIGLDQSDEWVLWIDADVCDYAPDTLDQLLAERAKIVAPNCVKESGGACYDLNSFLDVGTPRNSRYYKNSTGGIFQPPKEFSGRRHFDDLRYLNRTPLTGVGGTMLLVHSSVHRGGIRFPEIPYNDLIETEAFGQIASDFGPQPIGLPNLEIRHVDA